VGYGAIAGEPQLASTKLRHTPPAGSVGQTSGGKRIRLLDLGRVITMPFAADSPAGAHLPTHLAQVRRTVREEPGLTSDDFR
jgi:hypothetical protein